MTFENWLAAGGLALSIIAALGGLFVQTGKLIQIAEQYMRELKLNNQLQAHQVDQLANAMGSHTHADMGSDTPVQRPSVGERI